MAHLFPYKIPQIKQTTTATEKETVKSKNSKMYLLVHRLQVTVHKELPHIRVHVHNYYYVLYI